ncbi:hypothetical protein IAT38_000003 [Cryptococcus sp. DSM 104549]
MTDLWEAHRRAVEAAVKYNMKVDDLERDVQAASAKARKKQEDAKRETEVQRENTEFVGRIEDEVRELRRELEEVTAWEAGAAEKERKDEAAREEQQEEDLRRELEGFKRKLENKGKARREKQGRARKVRWMANEMRQLAVDKGLLRRT